RDVRNRNIAVKLSEQPNGTFIFRCGAAASIPLFLPAGERCAQSVPARLIAHRRARSRFSTWLQVCDRRRLDRLTSTAPFQGFMTPHIGSQNSYTKSPIRGAVRIEAEIETIEQLRQMLAHYADVATC